jgi:hypothetical protein
MIRTRNKSQQQIQKEALNPTKQNKFNTISLEGMNYDLDNQSYKADGCSEDFLDYLTFKDIPNEYDTEYDENNIESLMLPDFLKSSGTANRDSTKGIFAKVDKLFEAEKFNSQRRCMDLYFVAKMTQSEIEVYTREEGLFEGMTEEEIKTKVKRRMKVISRSIVSGVEKIQKKLTETDWNKIKYFYGVK